MEWLGRLTAPQSREAVNFEIQRRLAQRQLEAAEGLRKLTNGLRLRNVGASDCHRGIGPRDGRAIVPYMRGFLLFLEAQIVTSGTLGAHPLILPVNCSARCSVMPSDKNPGVDSYIGPCDIPVCEHRPPIYGFTGQSSSDVVE